MAYVNVKDWSRDQVTDWLKGLDSAVSHYTTSFLNNGVAGGQLLNLRADDLEHLGVVILGHQEIILEAVEHLRHFHFELDKENLQTLALRLSCASNSLYRELLSVKDNISKVDTQTLSDVHNIISTIKPLVCWLDRSPFAGDKDYMDNKTQMLQLAFEMATNAHRDIFSEKPVVTIRKICEKLAKMADHIIQEISDPMILQPASLDLATLKKKEQELGFYILPNNHAVHQIAEIKFGSPAHGSSKIEEGDEIVQVNYLTVVGWQRKHVMFLLQESPPEIVLTLKKRPRHTKVYGQIYMKPYRLPSKKRGQPYSRWNENLPSPVLLPMPDLFSIKINRTSPVTEHVDLETELSGSDSDPPDSPLDTRSRMYPLKPRQILQRRHTFSEGSSVNARLNPSFLEQYRELLKSHTALTHASSRHINNVNFDEDARCIRDKSASCSLGLELKTRPNTVMGLSQSRNDIPSFKLKSNPSIKRHVYFEEKKELVSDIIYLALPETDLGTDRSLSLNSLPSITNESIDFIDEGRELTDRSSMTTGWQKEIVDELIDTIKMKPNVTTCEIASDIPNPVLKDTVLADVNIHNIIKKFDEHTQQNITKYTQPKPKVVPRTQVKKPPEIRSKTDVVKKPVVPPRNVTTVITTKIRGKLDKSYSTPAYDLTGDGISGSSIIEKNSNLESISFGEESKVLIKEIEIVPIQPTTHFEIVCDEKNESPINKYDEFKSSELWSIDNQVNNDYDISSVFTLPTYELGIPIINVKTEETDSFKEDILLKQKTTKLISEHPEIVPPKLPPRTFGIAEITKPAYPIDSPKPANLVELVKSNQTTPRMLSKDFEFAAADNHDLNMNDLSSVQPQSWLHKAPSYEAVFKSIEATNPKIISNDEKPPKYFDPKMVSTPIPKIKEYNTEHEVPTYKNSPNFELQRNENKVSPTNSIVRAMIYSNKSKGTKRKNLIAKRRRVSVNDLNPADFQGWLFQRLRIKQTQHVSWERRWFVLFGNCLYGYKTKEDARAACLIFLSGFTVAVASEVKSRSNAFKVYHTGTVFYFSVEDPEALQCWIDLVSTATLSPDSSKIIDNPLFSETDDSDSDKSKLLTPNKQADTFRKFGSLKKYSSKKNAESHQSGSTSLDRKWLFFNKLGGPSKNALPVPTAQFRSYRRIRPTESQPGSITTGNFTSHVPMFAPRLETQHLKNISVPNLTVDHTLKPTELVLSKLSQNKPLNYVHASNPSLCNASEFNITSSSKKSIKQCNDTLVGFVTLEELMIKQSEERKLNPHNALEDLVPINMNLIKPDVVYGEVPIRPKVKEHKDRNQTTNVTHRKGGVKLSHTSSFENIQEKHETSSSCFGKRLGSLKKYQKEIDEFANKTATYPKMAKVFDKKMNSSLPRMHKLQERSIREGHGNHYYSDRNLAGNYSEMSYEMIYCPETVIETVQFAQNRNLDDRMCNDSSKKYSKLKKQHSFSSSDKKFKFDKGAVYEHHKASRIGDSSSHKVKLKSAIQYTPMSLPLSQDQKSIPKFAFELNLDEKSAKSGKLKQIFGKQNEQKKEKTFLGSPKLHRAIFRKTNASSDTAWPVTTQPIIQSENSYSQESTPQTTPEAMPLNLAPHIDYPGLEYPPVFEPETYTLADPQSSLTILRKQGKN